MLMKILNLKMDLLITLGMAMVIAYVIILVLVV